MLYANRAQRNLDKIWADELRRRYDAGKPSIEGMFAVEKITYPDSQN